MATGKKSFIAYVDWKCTFDALPDDKAGQLIKHIFAYVSDENPQSDDVLLNAVFANIKNTLKRDLTKWDQYIKKQSENGKKGGRPKKAKKPNPFVGNPSKPKKADSVSVSVSVSDDVEYNGVEIIGSDKAIKLMAKDESLLNAIAQKVPINYIHRKLPQFPGHCLRMGENGKNLRMHEKHFSGWVQKEWTNLSVSSKKKYR